MRSPDSQVVMIASLPMYPISSDAAERLWIAIAHVLVSRGMVDVPDSLVWPDDLVAHWRRPDLLVSQTCGYPLVTQLGTEVRVIGAFAYSARGCDGIRYRSLLIARASDLRSQLADFRAARVAYNSTNSQSGFNALRALVAPLAVDGRFFQWSIETGSHAASMRAVANDDADVAAIDCVSFAQICASDLGLASRLKVIGETPSAPGLPLITNGTARDEDIALLRAVLGDVVADPALAGTLASLMILGFEPIEASAYGDILAMEAIAIAAGYPVLS